MALIELSDLIQDEMKKRDWTASKLAHVSGIDRSIILRAVNCERMPNPNSLKSIAKALDLPIETLYRAAGLLPPVKLRDAKREILLHLADQLSEEEYNDVVRYTELRLAIAEEKGKYASTTPQEST